MLVGGFGCGVVWEFGLARGRGVAYKLPDEMPIEKILVLEDDLIVQKNLEQQLRQRGYEVTCVTELAAAQRFLGGDSVDLIFADIRLPDGEGTDLLKDLQHRAVKPLVVMTTGFASVESAVECMRSGAFDYLIKPFSSNQLEMTLKKAGDYSQLVRVNRYLSREGDDEAGQELLGRSAAMQALRSLIRRVAPTQATVLIQGESGTGKELVARALYRLSPRQSQSFIKINCAAVPENLIESEFFGHEKGAFTGALTRREGRFELANGGTILLDEISEISPQVQAKLLRVLQERELERVGGNRTIKVDVRVIATTNRNLEQSVERKEFRQDLFFRLNVVPVQVPPLRERKEDIPELADRFMQRFGRQHGVRVQGISESCMGVLLAHDWPGNVRELQNVIERAVILCGAGGVIEADHLGFAPTRMPVAEGMAAVVDGGGGGGAGAGVSVGAGPEGILPIAELERRQIKAALEHTQGNRTQAAKLLGISIRTLRNKLHDYDAAGVGVVERESGTG